MNPLYFIPIGIIVAFIKIAIEYDWYAKVKSEFLFHFIGAASITILIAVIWYFFGWKSAGIFWFSFWNVFELAGNFFHNKELLYVGEKADFDKFIRKHFRYKRAKLALHIFTILLIILIIFL